jgi:hypothetical protein
MEFDVNGYNDTFDVNIAPQEHNFNNGVWNRLEQKVRYWAVKYDGLMWYCGVFNLLWQLLVKRKWLFLNCFINTKSEKITR